MQFYSGALRIEGRVGQGLVLEGNQQFLFDLFDGAHPGDIVIDGLLAAVLYPWLDKAIGEFLCLVHAD